METTGEHLRRVRKTCGYSLEDVARVTKINLRYLEAIENDDFSKLPGEIFLQGFLRSYARFLGLNEQEILRSFKEGKGSGVFLTDTPRIEKDDERRNPSTIQKITVILPLSAGVITLLIIMLLFWGWRGAATIRSSKGVKEVRVEHRTEPKVEPKTEARVEPLVEPKVETKIEPRIEPNPETGLKVEPVEEKSEQVAQAPAAPSEEVVLKVYAKEVTWIQVRINEGEVKEALLKPGETVLWKGDNKITMTLGNAGGVETEINGKPQGPFGKSGEVVRDIVITTAGIVEGVTADSTQQPNPPMETPHIPATPDTPDKEIEIKDRGAEKFSPLMNPPP